MTDIKDTLAALSEAAADDSKSLVDRVRATSAFHQALVDAYFDGQLVPVPSVETVAFQIWHQLGQIEENVRAGALTQDEVRTIATAVIAAMKEGRE